MPGFELDRQMVRQAKGHGFDFALPMIKLHGFGGKTEFCDHGQESFPLMPALAEVTRRIRLFATTAVLTIPPAVMARMAATIDGVLGGRFGVSIASGWPGRSRPADPGAGAVSQP
jgi:pyrimidine oxygenase